MRCPKCYYTMQQVDYEGIEVDRCSSCGGIWFDAGEAEVLRHSKAAAVIDTGSAAEGKAFNMIDQYRCPRCGGAMERRVDSRQKHIWYEACADCAGSFFDAGEFRDLAQLTISDLFRSWVTPERG